MNPVLKSTLTTILTVALGSSATWLVNKGIITADQTNSVVELGSGIVVGFGAVAVGWWKSRQHTPTAQVAAIENMSTAAANAAVLSLPATAKNAIKIATMSDAAIVLAAVALPDVTGIKVASDAGPALSALAESPAQPKVLTEGVKP